MRTGGTCGRSAAESAGLRVDSSGFAAFLKRDLHFVPAYDIMNSAILSDLKEVTQMKQGIHPK